LEAVAAANVRPGINIPNLAQEHITAKWNKPVFNWNRTLAQLMSIFNNRLKLNL
jgi:hypothetical protein